MANTSATFPGNKTSKTLHTGHYGAGMGSTGGGGGRKKSSSSSAVVAPPLLPPPSLSASGSGCTPSLLPELSQERHGVQKQRGRPGPQSSRTSASGFASFPPYPSARPIANAPSSHSSGAAKAANSSGTTGSSVGGHGMGDPNAIVPTSGLEEWQRSLLIISRSLLGGSTYNMFTRATSAGQRHKKQRIRQCGADETEDGTEIAKKTLNAKALRRLRLDFMQGIDFCRHMERMMAETIGVLGGDVVRSGHGPAAAAGVPATHAKINSASTSIDRRAVAPEETKFVSPAQKSPSPQNQPPPSPQQQQQQQQQQPLVPPAVVNDKVETVEEGNPNGSTLRKHRKRSTPQPSVSDLNPETYLPEDDAFIEAFDERTGKRKLTKKEVAYRHFELSRFRTLHVGDFVAARIASHEVWTLNRVILEWKTPKNMSFVEIMGLSEVKRAALFDKVKLQDVDDDGGDGSIKEIERERVLPLPRSYQEAEEWGSRCRKGTRVYAMYPKTTTLYSSTVVDNTTYCRGEDDVIVLEFDEDEDDFGNLPQRHIPSRFVSPIPREFPAAQVTRKKQTIKKGAELNPTSKSNKISTKLTNKPVHKAPPTPPDSPTVVPLIKKKRSLGMTKTKKKKFKSSASTEVANNFGSDNFDADIFDVDESDSDHSPVVLSVPVPTKLGLKKKKDTLGKRGKKAEDGEVKKKKNKGPGKKKLSIHD
mmetsp:Transcript_48367/g.94496  ORF Transcript_48367/g.94496 Transcript_48367/m.94496 type:complete len:703 (-) Transcript_48367:26-2134(-)